MSNRQAVTQPGALGASVLSLHCRPFSLLLGSQYFAEFSHFYLSDRLLSRFVLSNIIATSHRGLFQFQ